ncbi:MAG: SDR family NAD(P)-dependent oxidoreductase [Deltaproteobacteria bacterium]|nr:SDR family NAD(P)-dependent oxidoreductase [Candidatus Zymogenaceae bacterium]
MRKASHFSHSASIVTGAASGIGRELARRLAILGARVYAVDIDEKGLLDTKERLGRDGVSMEIHRLDVTDGNAVRELFERIAGERGRIDYVFNNAGIAIVAETQDMTGDLWRRIVEVNLMGVIHGATTAYRMMVKQGFGHIINTASLAGLVPVSSETAYTTTKFGVVGLSLSLRGEGRVLGVKVSVVCPGFVRTEIMQRVEVVGATREKYMQQMPPMMDVEKAVDVILRGVRKNRGIIPVGLDAWSLWLGYRIWPGLMTPINNKIIRVLRNAKENASEDR